MIKLISLAFCVFISTYSVLIFATDIEQESFDANAEASTILISGFSSELNVNGNSYYEYKPIATRRHLWWWSLLGGLIALSLTAEADQAPSYIEVSSTEPQRPPGFDVTVDGESSDTLTPDNTIDAIDTNRQGRGLFFSASKSTDHNSLLKSTPGGPIYGTIRGNNYKYSLGYDEWSGDKILLGTALSLQSSETKDSRFNTKSTSSGASLLTFINLIINENIEFAGFLGHSRDKNERDAGLGFVTLGNTDPAAEEVGLDVTSEGSFTQYENFIGIQSTLSKYFKDTLNISSDLAVEYSGIKTDGYYSTDAQTPGFGTVLPDTQSSKTTLRFGISSAKVFNTPYGIAVIQGGIQYLNISHGGDSTKTINGISVFESDNGSLITAENSLDLNDRFLPTDNSQITTGSIGLSFIFIRGFQAFARYEQAIGGSNLTNINIGLRSEF